MAPQNEASVAKAVRSTEVQTPAYSLSPQSELKDLPGDAYGFISFLNHTFCGPSYLKMYYVAVIMLFISVGLIVIYVAGKPN